MEGTYRQEKDMLGEMAVPADALWGIHTRRALQNFAVSGYTVDRGLIKAMAMVKKAACLANIELGYLEESTGAAIARACDHVVSGDLDGQFPVDALQGGAGTSTNMNLNEVIANAAIKELGGQAGDYSVVDPLDHVNMHQSTNDVYPTALKIACISGIRELSACIERLQGAFQGKEKEFAGVVKIGRTEMQEAVPMTLGGEFSAFAGAVARDRWRAFKCEERLRVVNMGGTAIGTGLGAPRSYIFLVIEKLREITGYGLTRGENAVDQTANADVFVEVSGILKAHAANLIKISNDMRMLNMLGEIGLPRLQAGSSIMPGKINPVLLEAAVQAGIKVMADDLMVTEAVSRGSMQINEFMPLLSMAMLDSVNILRNIDRLLAPFIDGITAGGNGRDRYFRRSLTLLTAFVPHIGYEKASEIAREFTVSGETDLKGFLSAKLGKEKVEKILSPHNLMSLGYRENEKNT